jgi:hypothetical protein
MRAALVSTVSPIRISSPTVTTTVRGITSRRPLELA